MPLVEVILVINLAPLVTVVLGHFILHDNFKVLEIVCLVISFVGIVIMILGAYVESP